MSEDNENTSEAYLARYLGAVLEDRTAEVQEAGGPPLQTYGAGHIGPSFWADTPWRLEPGETEIPFTFIVRDAETENVKMRLEEIAVFEAPDDGQPWDAKEWRPVHAFSEGLGAIRSKFWVYRTQQPQSGSIGLPPALPLDQFETAAPGKRLLLKVTFKGSRLQLGGILRRKFTEWQPLVVYLASEAWPLRDTSQWYYGDTHYHSSYTNDIKEFGNPLADTRAAAIGMGLDWLTITDHSVDIDDSNPYWENPGADTRWDELGQEAGDFSDERFCILRGEEVTLLGRPGKKDDTLHMLVYGTSFDRLIPGAFAKSALLEGVAAQLTKFTRDTYSHLFGPIYKLAEVLTGVDEQGEVVPALQGRSVQEQGAIAFAAHPTFMAQAPGGTWEREDLLQPIQGMEAWNTRYSYRTGKEQNPFENWQPAPPWDDGRNKQGIELWDQMLRQKAGLDMPRFVLLGGSDAHGSFNYSVGWWVDWNGIRADDNCLGKVRTLLYLPHRDPTEPRRAPTGAEVVEAIRLGSCVVTDGPVVNFTVGFNGRRATLGQIMTISGDGDLEVAIQAASTAEFGPVQEVDVIYYFEGMNEAVTKPVEFQIGQSQVVADEVPSSGGYIRLAAATSNGEDAFRCFTNPIWIKSDAPGRRRLRLNCVPW
ncbi:MAG TPA: hypothetical protein VF177_01330 [Anaerolineae bacterium]